MTKVINTIYFSEILFCAVGIVQSECHTQTFKNFADVMKLENIVKFK